jgi:uncharacterized protein (DUF2062 family)
MLFGRKKPVSWGETIRVSLWPRRSWSRSAKYVSKRVLRLTASPHAISAGVAAGVFASFTPLLGLHFIIAFIVAYIIAGNFLAAASGTFFGNPLTFPFIWASTYNLGNFILSGETPDDAAQNAPELKDVSFFGNGLGGIMDAFIGIWDPIIKPMLIGGIPLGIFFGIIGYMLTRWAAGVFNQTRRKRIAKKAEKQSSGL